MAAYSESYFNTNSSMFVRTTNQMFNSTKYLLDPELRARRIVNISQSAGVDFCKVSSAF
jgi:hormone-sensitive lipase